MTGPPVGRLADVPSGGPPAAGPAPAARDHGSLAGAGGEGDAGEGDAVALGESFGVPAGVRRVVAPTAGATRIVLVRHGEAICNVNGIVGGVRGCTGLTELGRRQISALAARLEVTGELGGATALYASVLPRAVETAALLRAVVGEGALEVAQECALCELYPGESDGLSWQEVVERFGVPEWDTDPDTVIAPGGESWSGFVARASAAVGALAARHPGELVVAAVHAGVIESTMISFLEIPSALSRRGWTRIVHASLTEWEWIPTESRWVLVRFNDACGVPTA
ncbi:MAG: histidine phosphatase family protein [Acidimicrobiales bacterium]